MIEDDNTEQVFRWLNRHDENESLNNEIANLILRRDFAAKILKSETDNILKLVSNNVLRKVFVFSDTAVIIEHEKGVTTEPIRNAKTEVKK